MWLFERHQAVLLVEICWGVEGGGEGGGTKRGGGGEHERTRQEEGVGERKRDCKGEFLRVLVVY